MRGDRALARKPWQNSRGEKAGATPEVSFGEGVRRGLGDER